MVHDCSHLSNWLVFVWDVNHDDVYSAGRATARVHAMNTETVPGGLRSQ